MLSFHRGSFCFSLHPACSSAQPIHTARPSRASFYDDGGHLTTHGSIWTRESPNFLARTLLFWSYGLSTSCRDISFFAQRCFPSLIIIKSSQIFITALVSKSWSCLACSWWCFATVLVKRKLCPSWRKTVLWQRCETREPGHAPSSPQLCHLLLQDWGKVSPYSCGLHLPHTRILC